MHRKLLDGTLRLIASCGCETGCPGCVGPAVSGGPLAKTAAVRILESLLAGLDRAGGTDDFVAE
jgi:ATP-dependent helicase YprA (DUF1998 family)